MSLGDQIGRSPFLLRRSAARNPIVAKRLARRDTAIVIEGYPRSANSFAVSAFMQAQPEPVVIAHHLHAPAQVRIGADLGLPLLVLIRDPESAAASLVTRHPELTVGRALKRYHDFYSVVARLRGHLVLGDFQTVTTQYAAVVAAVNDRFGTGFTPYVNSPQSDARIFAGIDGINRTWEAGRVSALARPSEAKRPALIQATAQVRAHRRYADAHRLYRSLAPLAI